MLQGEIQMQWYLLLNILCLRVDQVQEQGWNDECSPWVWLLWCAT